jgi:mRNA-degrading endonuclease RelE of RelBE toxin-antitoxin system
MRYRRTPEFNAMYDALPDEIKLKARKAFELFKENPRHPSLQTKKLHGVNNIFEGRIDIRYRFTFSYEGDRIVFRTIGLHKIVDDATR